jgi:hypothetical protein
MGQCLIRGKSDIFISSKPTELKLPFNKDLISKLYSNKLNNLLTQLKDLETNTIDKLMDETKYRLIFNKKFPQIEKYYPFNRESAVKKSLSADYNDNDPKHKRWITHRNCLLSYIKDCKLTINWINKSTIENIPLTESQFNDLERWTTNS